MQKIKRYTIKDNKTGNTYKYSVLTWNTAWVIVFIIGLILGILL